jgi:hypothetical protein
MKPLEKSFNDENNILETTLLMYNGTMEFCCGTLGWELIMVQTEQRCRVPFSQSPGKIKRSGIYDQANKAF